MSVRISKDEYFLRLAKQVSARSTCLLIRFGAVLVKEDAILATGYNGTARGSLNCLNFGVCLKELYGEKSRVSYAYCPAVHAEENCIINAARSGVSTLGSTLYYASVLPYPNAKLEAVQLRHLKEGPCVRCRRVLINAGVSKTFSPLRSWSLDDLIERDVGWISERLKRKDS